MNRRFVQIIAVALCGGLLFAASRTIPGINAGRRSLNMYGSEDVTQTAPPEYAFAIQAFGAFRGIITHIAFIRAEDYKREGRYYDAMQLASWICKLQPHFPSVWEFHSWNMAWNISVTTYTPQERWNWVYNGAKLIRDEGLKYNPRAVNLYRQLAWVFVNKMSESTDEFHMTFKAEWAFRMHLVLGPPPDPLGDYRPDKPFEEVKTGIGDEEGRDLLARVVRHERERKAEADPNVIVPELDVDRQRKLEFEIVKKAAYDRMQTIANAPQTLAELYEAAPETREMVVALRELGADITDARMDEDSYYRDEGLAFTFFKPYRQLTDPVSLMRELREDTAPDELDEEGQRLERFDEIVGAREKRPAGQALLHYLQRRALKEVYKLDPQTMADLIAIFGPMDWRVVDAHSLYWVNQGLIAGEETISKFGNDKINTARLIFFSLRNLYYRNRLTFEPNWENEYYSYINFNLDLNFIESMHQAYLVYGKMLDPDPEETGVGRIFRTGHANFLADAIRALYFAGREREANYYYEYLRANYGRNSAGDFNPAYAKTLKEFVIDSMRDEVSGWEPTRQAITGLLLNAYNELSQGNLARYNLLVTRALGIHSDFNKTRMTEATDKLRLPPFTQFQSDVLRTLFTAPAFTDWMVRDRAQLWGYLPLYLKLAVYDDVRSALEAQCKAVRFNMARAFPPPAGIEEYRQSRPDRGQEVPDEDAVETPAQQLGGAPG